MRASMACVGLVAILGTQGCVHIRDTTPEPMARARATPPTSASWSSRVLYMTIPDRFANGDPSNDHAGTPDCFDRSNPKGHHGGDLAGLLQHRAYLSELGVTGLWVTPLNPQAADRCGSYHGYWGDFASPSLTPQSSAPYALRAPGASDDLAIAPTLGSARDLDQLLAELHAANISFMLDMVVNHSGTGAKLLTVRPDWFHDPSTCASLGDPIVTCPLSHLPDFAQEKPEVASYLTSMSTAWATRFAIDGIRMDTVKHVPIAYWKTSWWPAMRAARGADFFVVGEVLNGSGAGVLAPFLDAGFPSLFDYPLYFAFIDGFAKGGSLDGVAAKLADAVSTLGIERTRSLVTFIGNHDQPRFAMQAPGTPDAEMVRRLRLAFVALFTVPGIPQLYYGDELGFVGTDHRSDMPSWAWNANARAGAHDHTLPGADVTFAWVQRLIALRAAHPALFEGSYTELWRPRGGTNVFAFERATGTERVIVALNGGDVVSGPLRLATTTKAETLIDLLGGSKAAVSNGQVTIDLPPKTAAIYVINPPGT
jgi:glycosidase